MRYRPSIACALLALAACSGSGAAHRRGSALGGDGGRGRLVYVARCAVCHGIDARGSRLGPSLVAPVPRRSKAWIVTAIAHPEAPMPKLFPSQLSARDLADVTTYVEGIWGRP